MEDRLSYEKTFLQIEEAQAGLPTLRPRSVPPRGREDLEVSNCVQRSTCSNAGVPQADIALASMDLSVSTSVLTGIRTDSLVRVLASEDRAPGRCKRTCCC
ncbi:unnamed protein product [Durusdinium trenchii]|uniref:Uncharacterized protein n=1 Tax=Durusdinium trenchii TaxID=1381693 RepID=A0ABP0R5E9_9DINO